MLPNNPMSLIQCNVCNAILKRDFIYCPKCGTAVQQTNIQNQNNDNSDPNINPERVGIRLDVLDDIISNLNDKSDLQTIFGVPVSKGLVIVADENDLRIEDAGLKELTEEESDKFLNILDETIRSNAL